MSRTFRPSAGIVLVLVAFSGSLSLAGDMPGSNNADGVRTCYTGTPSEAVGIAGSLADSIYSDQLGFWGWKYKKEVHLEDGEDNEESQSFLNEQSDLWKNWRGNTEAILILSHQGDDGDDVSSGIIVKCGK